MRKEGGFEKTRFLSARNPNVHTLQFNTNVHSTSTFGINTNVHSLQFNTNVHKCAHFALQFHTNVLKTHMFTLHCSSVQCMNTNVLETQMCTVCTTVRHKCARTAQQFNRVHMCTRPKCALFSRFSLSLHNTVL